MDKDKRIPLNSMADIRKRKGLSQKELASIIGSTYVQISRMEQGEQMPKADMVVKVAAALGVSLDELLSDLKNRILN